LLGKDNEQISSNIVRIYDVGNADKIITTFENIKTVRLMYTENSIS